MNRRAFIKVATHSSIAAIGLRAMNAWGTNQNPEIMKSKDKRPNIVFALADDWGWPYTNTGRDTVLETPTFDKVACEGAMFTNAFVTAPSCTPSRGSILTGQWHWRLKEGANLAGIFRTKFDVYPDLLEQSGYHVGYAGKGWGPGDWKAGGRKRNPAGQQYKNFKKFLKARPEGKPLCFWFGSHNPHRGFKWQSGINSGMNLDDVTVPPCLPDNEIVRTDICDYYYEVQQFDREVGKILDALEETRELDNTMVVMSGDNGWGFPRGKANLYDLGTHVPLAICWKNQIKGGRIVEDFVSLADLAPTFLEAGGLQPTPEMTAQSLMPILTSDKSGIVDPERDYVITGKERHVVCNENRSGYPSRAIRTYDFLYIRNFKPERWPAGMPNNRPLIYKEMLRQKAKADVAMQNTNVERRMLYQQAGMPKNGFLTLNEMAKAPDKLFEELKRDTFVAFADTDSSPTKAFMVVHRRDPEFRRLYELGFERRPAEELYDLRKDPDQLQNVATLSEYNKIKRELSTTLMTELKTTKDPRALGNGDIFNNYVWLPDWLHKK